MLILFNKLFLCLHETSDLHLLHKLLHDNYKEMSTWDLYESEVVSGRLSWGILHTEKFFRENARRMEGPDGNFALLKVCAVCINHSHG